jgi:hypothetical protein
MKINLILKKLIILISITTCLKGSFFAASASKDKDFKDKYGVYLVLANEIII